MDQQTFPPPTSWPAPTWVPVTPLQSTPHRRRSGVVATLALVAMVATATASVVLSRDEPAEAYSLSAATVRAQDTSTVSYSYEMSFGDDNNITADVSMDVDRGLMAATMQMDMFDGPVEYVFDMNENEMYVAADQLAGLGVPVEDGQWIKFDVGAITGIDMSGLVDQMRENPLDATQMFQVADDVTDLGFDEVNGQQVRHFEVTVDVKTALEAKPELADVLGDLLDGMPETIVYDAYVTEANELVRLTYGYDVMGQPASVDMTVNATGTDVVIELPDPSTVVSYDELGL